MQAPTRALAALLLASPLAGQVVASDHVVGWTNSTLLPASGQIHLQDVDNGCRAAKVACTGVLLHNPVAHAGGTAYDARHQAVWVSDGRTLELRGLIDCKVRCSTRPHIMNPGAVVSGLAVGDRRRLLYQLETMPGYVGVLPYFDASCPPTPTRGGCRLALRPGEVGGGLAVDETRDLLYFTTSRPGDPGPIHTLHVARLTDRCNPVCEIELPACPATARASLVTGLAYQCCSRILYVTTGQATRSFRMVDPLRCKIEDLGCCTKPGGGAYAGLAVVPGWSSRRFGGSCTDSFCPACPKMTMSLGGGDPSLGNPDFAVQLTGAPARNHGYLLIGAGRCHKGVGYPFLCGAIHVPLDAKTVLVGPLYLGTGPDCTGTARVPIAVPIDANLCGAVLCGQWVVTCRGTKQGLGLTHALQFAITGS